MKKVIRNFHFDVCFKHTNMVKKDIDAGTKKQVIAFLKKQKAPYDWDVRACFWDGVTWELSCHLTGDEFLKDPDSLDYVKAPQKPVEQ